MKKSSSQYSSPDYALKPTVVLAEPIAQPALEWLNARARVIDASNTDRQHLLGTLANADGLIVRTYTIVDQELLNRAPNLRVIARAGVGLDNIDLDACHARSISVVHTPDANTQAVVEYVTSMMLSRIRPITTITSETNNLDWHALREDSITPKSCVGAKLGIIGLGKVGSSFARVASALGMEVSYHDLREISGTDVLGYTRCTSDELAASCDVISVHVDGRAANHHLINASFFDQLKPDVIFINTSRGFVLDTNSAARFARSNPYASLILDVHDPEPITPDSPLTELPNVIRTPHIAAGTEDAKEQMSWVVLDVLRVLEGKVPEFPALPDSTEFS